MADITMCGGKGCPIKEKCYRYTATPTPKWQAYMVEPYEYFDGGKTFSCGMFWGENAKEIFNKLNSIVKG